MFNLLDTIRFFRIELRRKKSKKKGGKLKLKLGNCSGFFAELHKSNIDYVIHDENLPKVNMFSDKQIFDCGEFKQISDVILANRMDTRLNDVTHKLVCRDIFNEN